MAEGPVSRHDGRCQRSRQHLAHFYNLAVSILRGIVMHEFPQEASRMSKEWARELASYFNLRRDSQPLFSARELPPSDVYRFPSSYLPTSESGETGSITTEHMDIESSAGYPAEGWEQPGVSIAVPPIAEKNVAAAKVSEEDTRFGDSSEGHVRRRRLSVDKDPDKHEKKRFSQSTWGQWLALFAGVLIQPFFLQYQKTHHWAFDGVTGWALFALITSILIFPAVYRSAFDPEKPAMLQLAPIFAAGLGWQSLLTTAIDAATHH